MPTAPGITVCYIPMSQIVMEGNWFVSGMQRTDSDTSVAKDVFVPHHRFVFMDEPYGTIEPGKRNIGVASDYLLPVPSVRAVGITAAKQMQEPCEAKSKKNPIVTTSFEARTDSAVAIEELDKVAAQLDSAESLLFDMLASLDRLGPQGIRVPLELASEQRAG